MKVNEVIVVYAAITVKEPANEMATVEVSVIRKSKRQRFVWMAAFLDECVANGVRWKHDTDLAFPRITGERCCVAEK